jgi:sarcosine oxidase subunit gamma
MTAMEQIADQAETLLIESPVRVALSHSGTRFSLRMRPAAAGAVTPVLGLELPRSIGARASAGRREALCLGPDEWLVNAPGADRGEIASALGALAATVPHSLTDISDRERIFILSGSRAGELLTIGCPRDIDRIRPGTGMRTLFDTVQVILWRDAPDRFRMDVWPSYVPHVLGLLAAGNLEFASGH